MLLFLYGTSYKKEETSMKSLLNADLEKADYERKSLYYVTTVILVLVVPAILGSLAAPLMFAWLAVGMFVALFFFGPGHPLALPAFLLTLAITYLALSGLIWAGMAYYSRKRPYLRQW